MKIINFGSLNIDHVYQVKNVVRAGETLASSEYQQCLGGKGCNQSVALAQAGASVMHAGKIGSDGQIILDRLAQFGVDISLTTVADGDTGRAIIQVAESGENAIFLQGGANQQMSLADIDRVMRVAAPGDYLLIQNEVNNLVAMIDAAASRSMTLAFNPSPFFSDIFHYPLDKIDLFFLNQIEAEMFSGEQRPEEVCRALKSRFPRARFVITLGAAGATYFDSKMECSVSAEPVTPVDTTAAGDTFTGFFLAELSRGANIDRCLKMACKAASLCVQQRGAVDSIPAVSEVEPLFGKRETGVR